MQEIYAREVSCQIPCGTALMLSGKVRIKLGLTYMSSHSTVLLIINYVFLSEDRLTAAATCSEQPG